MDVGRFVKPALAVAAWAFVAGCSSEANTLKPSGSGTASASAGEAAVQERGCPRCHGADMAGIATPLPGYDAPVKLYAPNLTPDDASGVGTWSDAQLVAAIREGVDKQNMVLCPQMQHYKTMPDREANDVVAYLRSLAPVSKKIPGSVCPPLKP